MITQLTQCIGVEWRQNDHETGAIPMVDKAVTVNGEVMPLARPARNLLNAKQLNLIFDNNSFDEVPP